MILYTLYLLCINRKEKKTINESLEYCRKYTFKAVCKTTIVIIVSLTPLLFSEFKSISQLLYNNNFYTML